MRDNVLQLENGTVVWDHDGFQPDEVRTTTFSYDAQNRQIARTLPLGQSGTGENRPFRERSSYDGAGRLQRTVDFEGRAVDYVYDDLERLDQKKFYAAAEASTPSEIFDYFYDGLGRQTKVIQDGDANLSTPNDQRVTDSIYDAFGRLERVTSPEGVIHYGYDNATGQLMSVSTGPNPLSPTSKTEYRYDDRLGRMTEVKVSWRNGQDIPDETTRYRYDKVGNLDQVELPTTSAATITDYDYDNLNRLRKMTQFRDVDGNDTFNTGDLLTATYEYTGLRADGKRTYAVEKFYDEQGMQIQENVASWWYDNLGRLTEERNFGKGSVNEEDYIHRYSFDLVGNRIKKTAEWAGGERLTETAYDYDVNNRIIWEKQYLDEPVGPLSAYQTTTFYTYDNPATPGDPNDGTQLTGQATYNYAINQPYGDVLRETNYTYNVQGRLESAEVDSDGPGGSPPSTSTYAYNADGIRVRLDEAGVVTKFLVDSNNPTGYAQVLEERNSSHTLTRSYTLGHDVISQWDNTPPNPTGLQYLLTEGHGSTRLLVNAAGTVAERYLYDAYGNMLSGTGYGELKSSEQASTRLLYSGEWTEVVTGWQYLRARFYDPRTGRMHTVDPAVGNNADPQSLHKYTYVHGDPIQGVDPSGLEFTVTQTLATFTAGGALVGAGYGAYLDGTQGALRGAVGGAFVGLGIGLYALSPLGFTSSVLVNSAIFGTSLARILGVGSAVIGIAGLSWGPLQDLYYDTVISYYLTDATPVNPNRLSNIKTGLRTLDGRLRNKDPKLTRLIEMLNEGSVSVLVDEDVPSAGLHHSLARGKLYLHPDAFASTTLGQALVTYAEFQHDPSAPDYFKYDNEEVQAEFDQIRGVLLPHEIDAFIRGLHHGR